MTAKEVLKTYWGYDEFRPLQAEIIEAVVDQKDTLALLPTGGGKSICFQVPGLMREGICLVVSPLIALMKDQVYNLKSRKISAEAVFSGMHYRDIDRILDNCIYGQTKFLYVSPERLKTELFLERIQKMNVNLIAVDEAHCISQWGYDFRPAYLEISQLREVIPDTPILALTATATKKVVEDIQQKLEFKDENTFQKSFNRSNLSYVVRKAEGKFQKLKSILTKVNGSAIVYARNRRKTKEIAIALQKIGISADYYHAGLNTKERSEKQLNWIENKIRVMACTNAFGMGIDKPDVRVVIHVDLPDSPEAYFQEAGRAGRDGNRSYAVLIYHEEDGKDLKHNFEQSFPPIKEIKQVYQALGSFFQLAVGGGINESYDFNILEFCKNFKFNPFSVYSCLKILDQSGWLTMTESVFIPSSLKVKVSKEELYDYNLKNRGVEKIIKTILRTYQGAFSHFVSLNEYQLAKFLKISQDQLQLSLKKLAHKEIIEYRTQKDAPQIIFLQDRVDIAHLSIDQKLYDFRKNRQMERIKKMISYAEDDVCREQQLLAYFGESKSEKCGNCDICLKRDDDNLSNDEFEKFKVKIQKLIISQPMNIKELVACFAPKREAKVLKSVEMLLDEGNIKLEDEKMIWIS